MQIRKLLIIATLLSFAVLTGDGQTAGSAPAAYGTYAEAMTAGRPAAAKNSSIVAEFAFAAATNLAKTDLQKADALIELAMVQKSLTRIVKQGGGKSQARTYSLSRRDEAYRTLKQAAALTGITKDKRAEIELLAVDIIAYEAKYPDFRAPFKPMLDAEFNKLSTQVIAQNEYKKIGTSADNPPSIRARAFINRAKTFDTAAASAGKSQEFLSAFADLNAAITLPGTSDEVKAEAALDASTLARRVNDANTVVGALEAVRAMPKATVAQKVRAYSEIAELYISNKRQAEARKTLAEALTLTGLTTPDKAVFHRLQAYSYIYELSGLTSGDNAGKQKVGNLARAELDKTVKYPGMSDDAVIETFTANGVYLRQTREEGAIPFAIEQFGKATGAKKGSERLKAIAQYEIGETYMSQSSLKDARVAYQFVSTANPQYHGYAQQRIKAIDDKTHKP